MASNHLTAEEREEIRSGVDKGETDAMIGDRLGRPRETINREINRNGGHEAYSPLRAQQRCDLQRRRPKQSLLETDPELAVEISRRLGEKDSPRRISIELAKETNPTRISHETIYRSVYEQRGLDHTLHKHLQLKRRRRKQRGYKAPDSCSLKTYNPISERDPEALTRTRPGDLEGDLIVGAYNRSALITVVDRMTRYLWVIKLNGKTADATRNALITALTSFPEVFRRTLAWDQGAEIAHHTQITATTGIPIYIAEPKSPWQRPSNENINAHVRRYVGKGTDLSVLTVKELLWIQNKINTIPRRSLNWETAQDHYYRQL